MQLELNKIIPIAIIIANGLFSWFGFRDPYFFDKFSFRVSAILHNKEYHRILSSGFLHANAGHLIFNMIAFYSFSTNLISLLGPAKLLLFYFVALIAGNLLSLFLHRHHPSYCAVGASGAVSGIIYASIIFFPESKIMFIFLPVPIPAWIFGIAYMLISMYGIKSEFGNIGHDAHFGGAISGVLLVLLFFPQLIQKSYLLIGALLIPSILFLIILIKKPELLHLASFKRKPPKN